MAAAAAPVLAHPFTEAAAGTVCVAPDVHLSYFWAGPSVEEAPAVAVAVHGAGQCALSFAALAGALAKQSLAVMAVDLRHHGGSVGGSDESELSLELLVADVGAAIEGVLGETLTKRAPPIALLGHSVGGAVVARLATLAVHAGEEEGAAPLRALGACLHSVVQLDCLPSLALASFPALAEFLERRRPKAFPTMAAAVQWAVGSRQYASAAIAAVPLGGMLVQLPPAEGDDSPPPPWGWRTDLLAAQEHWEGWVVGGTAEFAALPARVHRLAVTSVADFDDAELLTAQMAGVVGVAVLQAGHQLHENAADKAGELLVRFWRRTGLLDP